MSHKSLDTFLNAMASVWQRYHLKRITPLRILADYMMRTPIPWGISYHGHILYGLPLKRRLREYEPATTKFFKKVLKEGDVVADIGASNGIHTTMFSDLVGITGKVVAFEPDAKSFAWLQRSTKRLSNVIPEQVGVSGKKGTATLYARKRGQGMNSIAHKSGAIFSTISTTDLISYEKEHALTFTWAKIDVEGAELDVLSGMRPMHCTVEFAPLVLKKANIDPIDFLKSITSMGYQIHYIDDNGEPAPVTPKEILARVTDKSNTDLYLVPARENMVTIGS